jgi:hypothetical protein
MNARSNDETGSPDRVTEQNAELDTAADEDTTAHINIQIPDSQGTDIIP